MKNKYILILILVCLFVITACSSSSNLVIEEFKVDHQEVEAGASVRAEVIVRGHSVDDLFFSWNVDGGEIIIDQASPNVVEYILPANPKQKAYELKVTVRDENGNQVVGSKEITIKSNPPQITLSAGPRQIRSDQIGEKTIQLEAEIDNPDGRELSYQWEALDGGQLIEQGTDTSIDYQLPGDARAGERYTIQLTVDDGLHKVVDSIQIDVVSQPPQIIEFSPEQDLVELKNDQTQEFSIEAIDKDGYSLSYRWSIQDSNTNQVDSSYFDKIREDKISFVPLGLVPGEYTVTVVVEDETRNSVEHSWEINLAGTPPRITGVDIPTTTLIELEEELSVTAESDFTDHLNYNWSAEHGQITGSGSSVTYIAPIRTGDDQITVIVTDNYGGEKIISRTIEVNNNPPQIMSLTANGDSGTPVVNIKQDVSLKVIAEDSSTLVYRWILSDSDAGEIQNSDQSEATFIPAQTGTHTIEIRVWDQLEEQASAEIDVRVTELDLEIRNIEYDEVIKRNEQSIFEIDIYNPNPDADDSDLEYEWYLSNGNDDYIQMDVNDQSRAIFNPDQEISPGSYQVRVLITYGSVALTSPRYEVQVESLDPIIEEELSLAKSAIYNNQSVELNVKVSNPDGDDSDLLYDWQVAGGYVDQDNTSFIYYPDGIIPGSYELGVVITDGQGGRIEAEKVELEIKNRSPQIDSLKVSPEQIKTSQEAVIEVEASDPDGDQLTYIWSANDGEIVGEGKQVNYRPTPLKGEHLIGVEVRDSSGAIVRDSVGLEVTNSPPEINEFYANDYILGYGDETRIIVEAFDLDDDDNDLEYEWEAEPGRIIGSGGTVVYEAPEQKSDAIKATIRVTVSDPEGASDSEELELEVKNIWEKTLNSAQLTGIIEDWGDYIAVTADGQLLKLDQFADVDRLSNHADQLNDIINFDGGYLIAGFDGNDAYYEKIDTSDDAVEIIPFASKINSVIEVGFDGDFLLIGNGNDGQGYLRMIESDNWSGGRTFGSTLNAGLRVGLDEYIIAGSYEQQGYLVKVDSLGDEIWSREYGSIERIEAMAQMDKGYLLVADNYLIGVDEEGFELNSKYYDAQFRDIQRVDDGYLVVGEKDGSAYVIKLDDSLNQDWERKLNGSLLTSALLDRDSHYYVLVGESDGSGYLVRMDEDGNTGLELR